MNLENEWIASIFGIGFFLFMGLSIWLGALAVGLLKLFHTIAKSDANEVSEEQIIELRERLVKRARTIFALSVAGVSLFALIVATIFIGMALILPANERIRFAEAFGGTFGLYVCVPIMLIMIIGAAVYIAKDAWKRYRQVVLIIPTDFRNPRWWRRFYRSN